jgi:hypothetical protein
MTSGFLCFLCGGVYWVFLANKRTAWWKIDEFCLLSSLLAIAEAPPQHKKIRKY